MNSLARITFSLNCKNNMKKDKQNSSPKIKEIWGIKEPLNGSKKEN